MSDHSGPLLSVGVLTADLTRLGAAAVASTGIDVDAHLIVDEPRRLVPDVVAAGASVVTVLLEQLRPAPLRALPDPVDC